MLNIVLLCQYGASTGMLAREMRRAADERGVQCVINAYSFAQVDDIVDAADVVLLGPQIQLQKGTLEAKHASKGVPFVVIDTMMYGTLDGPGVLTLALENLAADVSPE